MDEFQGKIILDDTTYKTNFTKKFLNRKQQKLGNIKEIRAFIPGVIREINVKEGESVKKGTQLLILEAMKMKNRLFSPVDGVVKSINIKVDEKVVKNQLLILID
ncbi:MAG: acetyl-CoA carboxylase biotin carboxyl carrier protein subunit [Flavobacterium piscis]|jgi:biotin carboxyl carrier protein|nr:acetyl-CoA carboxylase biotin carboxyl carrier protein subunit [Flavobacterium piscis]